MARARAMATRWRSPPLSSTGRCRARAAEADGVEQLGRAGAPAGRARDPGQRAGQLDVLGRGQRLEQPEVLEHEARPSRGGTWPARERLRPDRSSPSTTTDPLCGASSPPSTDSSVDLPTPDAPTRATWPPGLDVQVEAVEHRDRPGPRREPVRQLADVDRGTRHGRSCVAGRGWVPGVGPAIPTAV